MTNKTFKQLIKEHRLHCTFALVINNIDTIIVKRIYKTTDKHEQPGLYYLATVYIKEDKLVTDIEELRPSEASHLYDAYAEQCTDNRRKYDDTCKDIATARLRQTGIDDRVSGCTVPMQQRKFWKIIADTLSFQLKDDRIISK